jgi:hypothetical protein
VVAAIALGLVAVVLAVLTAVGAWARATVVDTDGFVAAVGPLGADSALQQRITDEATGRTVAGLQKSIDESTGPLAPILNLLLGQFTPTIRSTIQGIVTGPQFQAAWETGVRDLHAQLLADLRGQGGGSVTATGSTITIDLGLLEGPLQQALRGNRLGELVAGNLDLGTITVPTAVDFDQVRWFVTASDSWSWLLPLGAVLLAAAAVLVAPHRPWALIGLGGGLVVAALVSLLLARLRVDAAVTALPDADRPLAAAFVDAVDDGLYRNLWVVVAVGVAIAAAGLLWWGAGRLTSRPTVAAPPAAPLPT